MDLLDGFFAKTVSKGDMSEDFRVDVYCAENVSLKEWKDEQDKSFDGFVFKEESPRTIRSPFVPYPPFHDNAFCMVLEPKNESLIDIRIGGDTYQFRQELRDLGFSLEQTDSNQW